MEPYLDNDTLYNVILNSDINTIQAYCVSSKNVYKMCDDKYFWLNKFQHDNLPILYTIEPINYQQWLLEYNYINDIKNTVYSFINLLFMELHDKINEYVLYQYKNTSAIIVGFKFKQIEDFLTVLNLLPLPFYEKIMQKLENSKQHYFYIELIESISQPIIHCILYPKDGLYWHSTIDLSYKSNLSEIIDILIKTIYYVPDVDLTDSSKGGVSYFLIDILSISGHISGDREHQLQQRINYWKIYNK